MWQLVPDLTQTVSLETASVLNLAMMMTKTFPAAWSFRQRMTKDRCRRRALVPAEAEVEPPTEDEVPATTEAPITPSEPVTSTGKPVTSTEIDASDVDAAIGEAAPADVEAVSEKTSDQWDIRPALWSSMTSREW